MTLSYILYQSRALVPVGDAAHDDILVACQRNNEKEQLTGFLHREAGVFLQYLEGPPDQLEHALSRIAHDPRHSDIAIIQRGRISKRYFPDWQMGFVDGDQLALSELLEIKDDQLDLLSEDPFDLVVFMASNADCLRSSMPKAA